MSFTQQLSIRWADIDANYHLRHSVYYDFCAQHRIDILSSLGLIIQVMQQQHLYLVYLGKNVYLKKKIPQDDIVFITTFLIKMKSDASCFSIRHEIKNEQKLLAIVTVEWTHIFASLLIQYYGWF